MFDREPKQFQVMDFHLFVLEAGYTPRNPHWLPRVRATRGCLVVVTTSSYFWKRKKHEKKVLIVGVEESSVHGVSHGSASNYQLFVLSWTIGF